MVHKLSISLTSNVEIMESTLRIPAIKSIILNGSVPFRAKRFDWDSFNWTVQFGPEQFSLGSFICYRSVKSFYL